MTFGTLEVYNLINLRNISNMNIEKFCLKWNEFDENIRHSFQALGHQQNLFDVKNYLKKFCFKKYLFSLEYLFYFCKHFQHYKIID